MATSSINGASFKLTLSGTTYNVETVEWGFYPDMNGKPEDVAIVLNGRDPEFDFPEPVTTVTVNLTEYGLHPSVGCIFIKDYSENNGLAKELTKLGKVILTGREEHVGPWGARVIEARVSDDWAPIYQSMIEAREAHR